VSEPGRGNCQGPVNSTMVTPRHWVGWPSPHYFWPLVGQLNSTGGPHLAEADGTPVPCDFHSLEDWKRLGLGPYHQRSGVSADFMDATADAFLGETLARAQEYRKLMVCQPGMQYPPIAVLRSDAVETVTGYRRPIGGGPFDFDSFTSTPGDGRVPLQATLPPEGVPVLRVLTNRLDHAEVLNDLPSPPPSGCSPSCCRRPRGARARCRRRCHSPRHRRPSRRRG